MSTDRELLELAAKAAGAVFNRDELDLLRQWYNSIKHCNPQYLDSDGYQDTALYNRICGLLRMTPKGDNAT